jgi:predicted nucleic acid-binding protein
VTAKTASKWVVVDSPGWIEYLANGKKADAFAPYLESSESILLPSVIVYEVYNCISRAKGKTTGAMFLSHALALGAHLIPLTPELSVLAADTDLDAQLGMTRAIVYASAQSHQAQLITSDPGFANLPGVTLL